MRQWIKKVGALDKMTKPELLEKHILMQVEWASRDVIGFEKL
jgi:hypothetical protein